MKNLLTLSLLISLLFITTACSDQSVAEVTEEVKSPTALPIDLAADDIQLESNIKEITVIAKNWAFEPSTITVNEGDLVKLTIKSLEGDHAITIPEFNIVSDLPSGKEVVIEFTADKVGTFNFFCSVYCGPGHGDMEGVLIVK